MDPQRTLGGRLVGHLLAKPFFSDFRIFWGFPKYPAAVARLTSGALVKHHFGT